MLDEYLEDEQAEKKRDYEAWNLNKDDGTKVEVPQREKEVVESYEKEEVKEEVKDVYSKAKSKAENMKEHMAEDVNHVAEKVAGETATETR